MIRQARVGAKVEETDASVTGLRGVPALVNWAHEMGLLKDVDALVPPKERDRGYAPSAAVFDLMPIPFAGGECIDDLAVLRVDQGVGGRIRSKMPADHMWIVAPEGAPASATHMSSLRGRSKKRCIASGSRHGDLPQMGRISAKYAVQSASQLPQARLCRPNRATVARAPGSSSRIA